MTREKITERRAAVSREQTYSRSSPGFLSRDHVGKAIRVNHDATRRARSRVP
jgi:hypothetical protein